MHIVIVGAGVAGLASAIALSKWLKDVPKVTVLEIRDQPSNIGGAVGIPPSALRCLLHLGVLEGIQKNSIGADIDKIELYNVNTGGVTGQINFVDPDGNGLGTPPLKGLRILRSDLLRALFDVVKSLNNVDVLFGHKTTSITEDNDSMKIQIEGRLSITADLLIGCDGIHSIVRTAFMESSRKPEYTGIAAVYAYANMQDHQSLHWQDTALCQSQRGSLMCSYYSRDRKQQYIAAVMEVEDVKSRQGWVSKGTEQDQLKGEIKSRYGNCHMSCLGPLIEAADNWTLYPVYKLTAGGKWCSNRAILIGDAAHAMPPQGESTGIALEDAILLARFLHKYEAESVTKAFDAYETMRRPIVNKAYDDATMGWETQKDSGWFKFQMKMLLTSTFLWWTAAARLRRYTEDIATIDLD